ncbi:hypothetical protein Adt_35302 [Abeliophyllum distichum]|uniref:Uncharacterized protein n=1 Tax=Abeliophyllum distichum TaxID=126358 RepID=A0ABD1QIC2_9LAMI
MCHRMKRPSPRSTLASIEENLKGYKATTDVITLKKINVPSNGKMMAVEVTKDAMSYLPVSLQRTLSITAIEAMIFDDALCKSKGKGKRNEVVEVVCSVEGREISHRERHSWDMFVELIGELGRSFPL